MQAENKAIESWLGDINRGVVRLPRFQRDEAWNHNNVKKFLETVILHEWPFGVLLTLAVDPDKQPFETRHLAGTVSDKSSEKCTSHLLDGQQRLTALWKALNDAYEDRVYLVKFIEENGEYKADSIESKPKSATKEFDPADAFNLNYMPISLLNQGGSLSNRIGIWLKNVDDVDKKNKLQDWVIELGKHVNNKSFPFLQLPQTTDAEDAIDIFIDTNTSIVRLTHYNIAVAMFEAETQASLQELVNNIGKKVPAIIALEGEDGLGDLILKVACLRQNMMPTYGNYKKLDMKKLQHDQAKVEAGVRWATEIINEQNIWHMAKLPSSVPLRVLPALFEYLPKTKDVISDAKANALIRGYIWRAFFTDRYDRQANDRLKKDYDALRKALESNKFVCSGSENNIFVKELPNKQELLIEGWPYGRGIRKRAILAVCNREGARDVASGKKILATTVSKRQYHHIYPKDLLKNEDHCDPELALNCMLIHAATNNQWSNSWPGDYLLQIHRRSKSKGMKSKNELKKRLQSHLIPPDAILEAIPSGRSTLRASYKKFLDRRAELIISKMNELCSGATG